MTHDITPRGVPPLADLLMQLQPGHTPSWTLRYRAGSTLNRELDHVQNLDAIGAEIGCTRQMAYHVSVLALGIFACRLYLRLVAGGSHVTG